MPIALLPEAIARVRRAAAEPGTYVNPWNGVSFAQWAPITTRRIDWLRPSEDADSFTAYEHAMEIYQAIQTEQSLEFEYVGLQPNLADFNVVYRSSGAGPRSNLIQHKVDGRKRAKSTPLTKVAIARQGRHYFQPQER